MATPTKRNRPGDFAMLDPESKSRMSRDLEASMSGRPQPYGSLDDSDAPDPNAIMGTKASGYATPDQGPFRCDNCAHFTAMGAGAAPGAPMPGGGQSGDDEAQGNCDHPLVIRDPEVKGSVMGGGCCTYFNDQSQEGDNGGPDDETAEPAA